MPAVEETLASYLSVGETSSLKASSLPSKPLQKYAAAGQAVASLHCEQEGPGLSPNNAGVLAHLRLGIRDGHRRLLSQLVPLPRLRVGLEEGAGQREVGKTRGRWSRRGILIYSLPWGGGLSSALIFPSLIPLQPNVNNSTWPRLGGDLETCVLKTLQSICCTNDVWLSSMFHRNYLTDIPDPTLRTLPPGLISCAGTMDGWVRSSSTVH